MKRSQFGFSLVELLIAIALGVLLMTGVVQMFIGSKQTFGTQQGLSRVQETGRLAIEFLLRDLREAGHYGCYSPANKVVTVVPSGLDIGGLQKNFDYGVMAFESVSDIDAAEDLGNTVAPLADRQILVVRSASPQVFVGAASNTANEVFAYSELPVTNNCVGGICNGSAVVVSDCAKARIFPASTAPTVNASLLTVTHSDSWGGGDKKAENFDQLSEVAAMNTTVYFLATGVGGGPSLFQKVNGGAATELVEDVENINYMFRLNDVAYKTVAQMKAGPLTNWKQVTAIRIEILVRSNLDNVVERPQPYTFAGTTVAQSSITDRRIRKVFTTTVNVRNQ